MVGKAFPQWRIIKTNFKSLNPPSNRRIFCNDSESDWEELNTYKVNKTEKTTEFRVDRTAPEFSFENVGGLALDSFSSEKYASFKRPSRNEGFMYV